MNTIILSGKGRRWLERGHPWIYRDDVHSADASSGDLVRVLDPREAHLGFALYSSSSRIAARMVTRSRIIPDRSFWSMRVERAIDARERAGLSAPAGACRLIAGDADGVPGLVIDRYANTLVAQSGTHAADLLRDLILELCEEHLGLTIECVVDRSDSAVRRLEGLDKRVEVVRGALATPVMIREDDLDYEVDVLAGHKTGHYLDQRDNRRKAALSARGEDVLDAFCYDGLFGIRAALAGARKVTCIDQSQPALDRLLRNASINGVADRIEVERADCMAVLRARSLEQERYGVVVVDPPAFAKNRAEIAGAARGYVELNRRAMTLVRQGGLLVSASCSYNVRPELFIDYLAQSAQRAQRDAYLIELCGAAADHPALLTLPESSYLKCAFVRVEERERLP